MSLIPRNKCTCGASSDALCTCDRNWCIVLTDPITKKRQWTRTFGANYQEARKMEAEARKAIRGPLREDFLKWRESRLIAKPSAKIADLDCYLTGDQILKTTKGANRNLNDLYLVVAWAMDLWTVNTGGRRGQKIGSEIPDREKIGKLPVSVLTWDLVRKYYAAKQRELYGLEQIDWVNERENNVSINSTLAKAADVFCRDALLLKFEHLNLPDLTGFRHHKTLQEPDPDPTPIHADQFAVMLEARKKAPAQIALVNLIATQTGMRPCSISELHTSWLVERQVGYGLNIKVGKTTGFTIPITDELAEIVKAADGYVLAGDQRARRNTAEAHATWIKSALGIEGTGKGTYLLRQTAASIVKTLYGMAAAKAFLGHQDDSSLKHYANVDLRVSAEMRHELRAALTLAEVVGLRLVA